MELCDAYGRTIDYLRISLTDRCNLRCKYCMPMEGIPALRHEDILTLEETFRIAKVLTGMGIRRIRLTGGEPLVRRNMLSLVQRLGALEAKPELAITTNGILLEEYLEDFLAAGLKNINISLDTKQPETFRELTGMDGLDRVLRSIEKAVALGMRVKLNSVLIRGVNEGEMAELAGMAKELPVDVRFIELMPIGPASGFRGVSREEILKRLKLEYGECETAEGQRKSSSLPDADGPAQYVQFQGFQGRVGFISPLSHAFCESCNRVRLTADGRLKLCLFYPDGPSLLPLVRGGCDDETLRKVILQGLQRKPKCHGFGNLDAPKEAKEARNMNQIGG